MDELLQIALDLWAHHAPVIVSAGAFLLVLLAFRIVFAVHRRMPTRQPHSAIETRFRNVFAMMTEDRRQRIIEYYSRKNDCGREEAMKLAVEDRSRDEGRW